MQEEFLLIAGSYKRKAINNFSLSKVSTSDEFICSK